ncbi:MAG: histidine kinase dimerization/phospho-acceptor domain-containing protein [bacterium]
MIKEEKDISFYNYWIDAGIKKHDKQFYSLLLGEFRPSELKKNEIKHRSGIFFISDSFSEDDMKEDNLYFHFQPEQNLLLNCSKSDNQQDFNNLFYISRAEDISTCHEIIFWFLQQQGLKKLLPTVKKILEDFEKIEDCISDHDHSDETTKLFLPLQEDIFTASDFHQAVQLLENFLKKHINIERLKVTKALRLYKAGKDFDNGDMMLPLWGKDQDYWSLQFINIFGKKISDLEDYEAAVLLGSLSIFQEYVNILNLDDLKYEDGTESFWEDIFKAIQRPFVLINAEGELLYYNQPFSELRLLPKQCLHLSDQEKIEIGNSTYKIWRRLGNDDEILLFFYDILEFSDNEDVDLAPSSDLGIITSSVAHELNNPIAGILAAITVIELDEDLNPEVTKKLDEMKESVKRCKNLITTFLGFSKTDISSLKQSSLEEALSQAFNLIRFRMIESNVKLDFKIAKADDSSLLVNSSIFAMVMYLILGELITAYSYSLLLSDLDTKHHTIDGEIILQKNGLIFVINNKFSFHNQLASQKLMHHLLDLENMNLQINDNQIILTKSEK